MNKTTETTRKYIYAHTSQETAYIVKDYPWGFRLRTTIRYWIESKAAKNGGQRFASQTINPKTGKWCAPKYSTYSPIVIMFLDEKDHVKYTSLGHNSGEEIINLFKETHLAYMSEFQKNQLREIVAYTEVMKHVKFEVKASDIGPVSLFSNDPKEIAKREQLRKERAEREAEQAKIMDNINRAINHEYNKNKKTII